jgi:hypothetical protein
MRAPALLAQRHICRWLLVWESEAAQMLYCSNLWQRPEEENTKGGSQIGSIGGFNEVSLPFRYMLFSVGSRDLDLIAYVVIFVLIDWWLARRVKLFIIFKMSSLLLLCCVDTRRTHHVHSVVVPPAVLCRYQAYPSCSFSRIGTA